MFLGEVIEMLEKEDPNLVLPNGFACPHSYRGDYSDLAFEPRRNMTVGEMLFCARTALGNTYTGYKGGSFKMDENTECYLANYGCCGEELGSRLLSYMIKEAKI